jgi:hypothetical protein
VCSVASYLKNVLPREHRLARASFWSRDLQLTVAMVDLRDDSRYVKLKGEAIWKQGREELIEE